MDWREDTSRENEAHAGDILIAARRLNRLAVQMKALGYVDIKPTLGDVQNVPINKVYDALSDMLEEALNRIGDLQCPVTMTT